MRKVCWPSSRAWRFVRWPRLSLGQEQIKWKIHDRNRPLPPVVDPGNGQHARRTGARAFRRP